MPLGLIGLFCLRDFEIGRAGEVKGLLLASFILIFPERTKCSSAVCLVDPDLLVHYVLLDSPLFLSFSLE